MQIRTSRVLTSVAHRLHDPFSTALLPLVNGLSRRWILGRGATEREHRLAGVRVHLYHRPAQGGADLPVVLVHGLADSALTWIFQIEALSVIGPVYAVDLSGFGLSGLPAGRPCATIADHLQVLHALITEVVQQPCLVVGNSLGGWLAVRLANQAPNLMHGIVLLNPGGALLEGLASWQPFVDMVRQPDLRTVRRIYRQMFGRVPEPLYLGQRGFQEMFSREPVQRFVETEVCEADMLRPEELKQLTTPVGLIWGEADHFLPAGSQEFFLRHLPQAETLLLPGCGHLPQRERPRAVNRFVSRFAQQVSAYRPTARALQSAFAQPATR